MSLDLNLLPSQAKFQAERTRIVVLVKRWVGIFTGVWVLTLGVVLGWWWYMNGVLLKTQEIYLRESTGFKPELVKISKGQELRGRLQTVKNILVTRFEYGAAFRKMKGLFSDEVTVKSLKLTEKGVFAVSVEAVGTQVMDIVEGRMMEINSGKSTVFSRMKLVGVAWENGVWRVSLEVSLADG